LFISSPSLALLELSLSPIQNNADKAAIKKKDFVQHTPIESLAPKNGDCRQALSKL
jgi:hypothetical protein